MNTQHLREMIQSVEDELQLARSFSGGASRLLVLLHLSIANDYLRYARAELRRLETLAASR